MNIVISGCEYKGLTDKELEKMLDKTLKELEKYESKYGMSGNGTLKQRYSNMCFEKRLRNKIGGVK